MSNGKVAAVLFFSVSRGIRQGSLLSPIYFNMYINDLLQDLACEHHGCKVGRCNINVLGYADDVTLISNRVTDLQNMINKCSAYAKKWRFSYGLKKSKCMIVNGETFNTPPS